jgi:hypothetical protein
MKLALTREKSIEILTTSGEIEPRDAQILKVGITKLIRDGKNQIAIEVSQDRLPVDVIRELVALDLIARELSGRVLIVTSAQQVRHEIENFARPATLETVESRVKALEFFEALNSAPLAPIPVPVAPAAAPPAESPPEKAAAEGAAQEGTAPETAAPETAAPEKVAEEEVKQLREQIRDRELKEVGELRKTISRLEEENKALLAQLATLVVDRRAPPDEAAYRDRVRDLEDKLEKLMEEVGKEKGK